MDLKDLPSSERSKIASLLQKEKKQDDIGWMYNQPQNDSEAYLLGKQVTSIEQIEKLGQDYEESPAQRLARIDMEAKFREDPLTAMKQREAEKRLELLRNTAKVKKLRRLLTMQKHLQEKHQKRKRLEKKRKRDRSRSSSSSSDSSSGDELLDKFIKIVRQSDEIDAKHFQHKDHTDHKESKPDHEKKPETFRRDHRPSTSQPRSTEKPKLTREELEARRIQMMNDAKEHAKDRSTRTSHHYRKKEEQELRETEDLNRHGASFIHKIKNDHAQRGTIEDSIHRKASTRQRGELSSNFLKR